MIKNRLTEFLTIENISATKLAEEINVQASSISHILSERNKPSYDFLVKLFSAYPRLNPKWLMMGTGQMYLDDISTHETPRKLRKIETPEKQETEQFLNLFTENEKIPTINNDRKIEKIVLFFSDKTFETYTKK